MLEILKYCMKIIKKTNKNSDTIFWGRCHCLSGIVRLSNNKKIDGLFLVKSSSMVYANSKSCLIGLSITLRKEFNLYWIWELVIGSLYPNSCLCWKHGKLCYRVICFKCLHRAFPSFSSVNYKAANRLVMR